MSVTLSKQTIDREIGDYVVKLPEIYTVIKQRVDKLDSYGLLKFIKRHPLGVGPYPDVSLFENCNRVFSDLVILFGVKRLLSELAGQFPFTEYCTRLGTEQGIDLEAHNEKNSSLVGEAFSVARTFFPSKKLSALKSVLNCDSEYKLLIFNADAVTNPADWDLKEEKGVFYLTVDVELYLGA